MARNAKTVSPRTRSIAFRIWAVAEKCGWDLSASEAARRAGVKMQELNAVLQILHPDWRTRFRAPDARPDYRGGATMEELGREASVSDLGFVTGG